MSLASKSVEYGFDTSLLEHFPQKLKFGAKVSMPACGGTIKDFA